MKLQKRNLNKRKEKRQTNKQQMLLNEKNKLKTPKQTNTFTKRMHSSLNNWY